MKTIYLFLAFFTVGSISMNLFAQDEFEQVRVLDHSRFSLTDRIAFDFDITFLPLDAYRKPILGEFALSYQPADWFSWEVGRIGYSLSNYDTGLATAINNQVHAQVPGSSTFAVDDKGMRLKDLRYHASSTGYFNMLYSKSNFFNTGVVYYYWQLGSGISYYDMKSVSQVALDLAMRIRFFINNNVNVYLRAGQSLGFKSEAPKSITFLGLGVGFAL